MAAAEPTTTDSRTPERAEGQRAVARRRPRWMLWAGIAALVVFAAFAIHVGLDPRHPFTQPMDDAWRRIIGSKGPELGIVPMFFQELGEAPGFIVIGLLIPIALLVVGRWRSALFSFVGFGVASTALSQVAKNLVNRPRPAPDLAHHLYGPLFQVDHGSFPSGHAVSVGALIVMVAALIPAGRRLIWWCISVLLAVGIVWQRTLVNAHWLSDTFSGLLAGSLAVVLVWWAFYPLIQKDYGRPIPWLRRGSATAPQQKDIP